MLAYSLCRRCQDSTYLVVLVVVVVSWTTVVALCWAAITCLLSVATRRRSSTVAWSTLSTETSLCAVSLVLWLRASLLGLAVAMLLWRSTAAVLSGWR
jgi:hypothetical protein